MIIAALVIVVLVIAAAGAYLYKGRSQGAAKSVDRVQEAVETVSVNKGSIRGLIDKDENVTCSVKYLDNEMSGTVYIAGGKVRGDFTTAEIGEMPENHMIQNGEYTYIWTNLNQGIKMKISEEATQVSPSPQSTASKPLDLDEQIEMDCDKWSVDESMFVPPSDVSFSDLSDAGEKLQEQSKQAPQNTQDVCASITDPQAKAACKSATGQ
ncbi:MAG: hypothetical protein UU23_C0001G0078 [Candidatus Curtissbacteria bacterium GW2011_GWA1_40_9]|uniref:Uncharacterized protein n=1 Tax=Candidatus Curtissbacteria bacterium GW2011_GWA1_40_9 TaxID=1618408 RepID=A0A0G0TMQ0_9BACT|nr:MAG: hypothetical protein UU23_C0001G0078 [Candidatus Curtissbacteria bacterium GW2011_GWA1_40_9]